MPKDHTLSRRKFLQYSGALAGAAATFGVTPKAGATEPEATKHNAASHSSGNPLSRGRMFFTNDREFNTLGAAAERIFPKDENGPGALELAVPYFIDNQLAGAYGYNAREYVNGPYFPGAATQGYQSPMTRRDVFRQGLIALNLAAQTHYSKDFTKLSHDQQDQILAACEAGTLPLSTIPSSVFFGLLRSAVLAGVYADPIYNGNNNMDAWRMKKYPGAQMSYIGVIDSNTFEIIDPVSLSSMQ